MQQRITPFLWFDGNAEEAMNLYVSIFKHSKLLEINRFAGPDGSSTVVTGRFQLEGQEFMALNGGPAGQFTEAISFFVSCQNQQEVDELWDKLCTNGGQPSQCGWLKDKFGVSWQIIPTVLGKLLGDPDPEKSGRVMQAMLKMQKIDVAALERAHAGEP